MEWLRAIWQAAQSVPGLFQAVSSGLRYAAGFGWGWFLRGMKEEEKREETMLEKVDEFQDQQQRLRVDPAERERLRRLSGKPPAAGIR